VTIRYEADGAPHRSTPLCSRRSTTSARWRRSTARRSSPTRHVRSSSEVDSADAQGRVARPHEGRHFAGVAGHRRPTQITRITIRCHIKPTGNFLCGGPTPIGLTDGRSSSIPTVVAAGTAAAPSAARIRPRSIAPPRTWHATSPRTSSRPVWQRSARCSLFYAIGYPDPLNIWVTLRHAGQRITEEQLVDLIRQHFKLTPRGAIIETLDLRKPIYHESARHGHFAANCRSSPGNGPTSRRSAQGSRRRRGRGLKTPSGGGGVSPLLG